jgi:DNA-binding response OmpR family regulator
MLDLEAQPQAGYEKAFDQRRAPSALYRILNNVAGKLTRAQPEERWGTLPLCDRCGEEIALANDIDQAGDIDRRRHVVLVAGKPRRLTPTFWRLFTLLYRHRGDVVYNDQLHAELYRGDVEQPMAGNVIRENVRRLRKVLIGSRYEIVNHPTLGYELIVADASDALATAAAWPPKR